MIPFDTIDQLRKLTKKLSDQGQTNDALTLAAAIHDVVQATENADFYANASYGGCPFCGKCEELRRVADKYFALCHEHQVYWYIGAFIHSLDEQFGMTLLQNGVIPDNYRQIAISDVFITPICPCCGLFQGHSTWCIVPMPAIDYKQSEKLLVLPDSVVGQVKRITCVTKA